MSTAFYETYRQLCQEAGKSDNAVAAEIGLSNSTVTTWKQGALPRRPTIKKVAEYFGVTMEEMMGYAGIEKAPTPEGEHKYEEDAPDENYIILSRNAKKLSPEKRQQLLDMAKIMFKEEFKD